VPANDLGSELPLLRGQSDVFEHTSAGMEQSRSVSL
jgi:hypothetical protein